MSHQESERSTNNFAWVFLIFVFAIFLLGVTGLAWWMNADTAVETQPSNEKKSTAKNSAGVSEKTPGSLAVKPTATYAAPVPPTAVSTSLPEQTPVVLPTFDNPLVIEFREEAELWEAEFIRIDADNTGIWQFQTNSFVHPLALEINQDAAFLLDGGEVLAIDLEHRQPPYSLLAPGFDIDGVQVQEPLDLALAANSLFVLDRAGDVYRYDLADRTWHIDRYDRPVEASSGHYFVAVDGTEREVEQIAASNSPLALLETNYKFTMLYGGETTPLWNLPEGRSVDLSVQGDDVYVLQRAMHDSVGSLLKYRDTRLIESFSPRIEIEQPLQLVATDSAVYVLDHGGRRLRALDPNDGKLLRIIQLPQHEPASAFAVTAGEQLIFASRDRLYFFQHPEQLEVILDSSAARMNQPHDPMFLASLDSYSVPIGGSNITFRDFQLPGAPRHYRLGVHQGIDFYWQPGTKVLAAADGVVIRADIDYVAPTSFQLSAWWNESQERGYTSKETLNKYLGRQVWIEHDDGIVSRYAHLRSITPGIQKDTLVTQGQVIGEVGNSGSPSSLESERADAHLHFEIWAGDNYLGQFLRPIEVREWVERILTNNRP